MQELLLPDSVPEEIRAWLLPLDLTAPIDEGDWQLLSHEEKMRAVRFHHKADCVRMVKTRSALRRQLGKSLHCKPESLHFELGENGKPELTNNHQMSFNVSHSGEYALITLSSMPSIASLGIDIEQKNVEIEIDDFVEYAFTPVEREYLYQCKKLGDISTQQKYTSAFFLNWVSKEAVLKSVGVGISEHLQSISIQMMGNGQLAVVEKVDDWHPINVQKLKVPSGYSAAVAWQLRVE